MNEQVFRGEWGRVVASLVSLLGDVDLAEDAAQEAFAIAVEQCRATARRRTPAPGW